MTSTKLMHSSWESDHPQRRIFTLKMQGGLHQWPFLETRRKRLSNSGFSHSEKVFWSQLIKGLTNPKATNLTRFLIQQQLWLREQLGFCLVLMRNLCCFEHCLQKPLDTVAVLPQPLAPHTPELTGALSQSMTARREQCNRNFLLASRLVLLLWLKGACVLVATVAMSRRLLTSLLQGRVTARNTACYANNLVTQRAL